MHLQQKDNRRRRSATTFPALNVLQPLALELSLVLAAAADACLHFTSLGSSVGCCNLCWSLSKLQFNDLPNSPLPRLRHGDSMTCTVPRCLTATPLVSRTSSIAVVWSWAGAETTYVSARRCDKIASNCNPPVNAPGLRTSIPASEVCGVLKQQTSRFFQARLIQCSFQPG